MKSYKKRAGGAKNIAARKALNLLFVFEELLVVAVQLRQAVVRPQTHFNVFQLCHHGANRRNRQRNDVHEMLFERRIRISIRIILGGQFYSLARG